MLKYKGIIITINITNNNNNIIIIKGNDSEYSYGAKINLDAIPLLPGAEECIKNGIFSSLYPENIRCKHAIEDVTIGSEHPAYPILFDPQTSGGLIASIPSNKAIDLIAKLHDAGYEKACVVGSIYTRDCSHADTESESSYIILERNI
jgi:hypothetical protein